MGNRKQFWEGSKSVVKIRETEKICRHEGQEEYQVHPEEKAWVQEKKDCFYLNWLDRVETMLGDEEKALVEKTEDQVYIDRLVSNEDKTRIEALIKYEEFLTLMEAEHGASNRLNHAVNLRTGIKIQ